MPAVLTDFEKQVGSSWLKAFKLLNASNGQLTSDNKAIISKLVHNELGTEITDEFDFDAFVNSCKKIGEYIMKPQCPGNNDDYDIVFIDIAKFYTFLNSATQDFDSLDAEQLARVIAKFCNKVGIIWSIPRYYSAIQLDDFTNEQIFGKALKEFGCIEGVDPDADTSVNMSSAAPTQNQATAQPDPQPQAQPAQPDPAMQMNIPDPFANQDPNQTQTPDPASYGTPTTSSPVANSGKPVSVFKSQGSLAGAGEIRDLKNPKKEYMTNCYKIVDKANTVITKVQDKNGNMVDKVQTEFRVFINPFTITYKGKKKGGIPGPNGLTNVVRLGSSKDYIDCVCYFKDKTAAQAFADRVMADINANKIILTKRGSGSLVTPDLEVISCKNAKAGYFEVGTVYGNTYIVAPKANESLETEGE